MDYKALRQRASAFAHVVEDCGLGAVPFDVDGINIIALPTSDILALCDAVEALEKDLRWCIDEMTETTDKFGLPDVPRHECEYLTRPDKGTCAFHERFVDIMDRLGYFTEALALLRQAPTASTPTPAAPSDA